MHATRHSVGECTKPRHHGVQGMVGALALCVCALAGVPGVPARAAQAPAPEGNPKPPEGRWPTRVLQIFVDGLRPDVLEEMAAKGELPHIKKWLLDRGVRMENCFCALPSYTLTSTATILSGEFNDRHGLKFQVSFDRNKGRVVDRLQRSALAPTAAYLRSRGVKLPSDYVAEGWSPNEGVTTVLPFMSRMPQLLEYNKHEWEHDAVNEVGYASRVKDNFDDAEGRYTLRFVADERARAMVAWFASLDEDCHNDRTGLGQAGPEIRKVIINLDHWIGRVFEKLDRSGMADSTYVVLFSDHGHTQAMARGSAVLHNTAYDLERDFLHATMRLGAKSLWDRGSVFACPGEPPRRYAVLGDVGGDVDLYLPYAHGDSGDFRRRNGFAELVKYRIRKDSKETFNVIQALGALPGEPTPERQQCTANAARPSSPVDFVVVKITEEGPAGVVLLYGAPGSQALVFQRDENGQPGYRYQPVSEFPPAEPAMTVAQWNAWADAHKAGPEARDPLEFFWSRPFAAALGGQPQAREPWFAQYHTADQWLNATYQTNYPGVVDSICHLVFWRTSDAVKTPRDPDPDCIIFANRGWAFLTDRQYASGEKLFCGSEHGHAIREVMRTTLLIAGPKLRQGYALAAPHRTVDILPTVLRLLGKSKADVDALHLDGKPIEEIFPEAGPGQPPAASSPAPIASAPSAAWDDAHFLPKEAIQVENDPKPGEKPAPHEALPYQAHIQFHSDTAFLDPHQIKDNVIGLLDFEILKTLDLPFAPVGWAAGTPVEPFEGIGRGVARLYDHPYSNAGQRVVGGFFRALNLERLSQTPRLLIVPRLVYLSDWLRSCFSFSTYVRRPLTPSLANQGIYQVEKGALWLNEYVAEKLDDLATDVLFDLEDGGADLTQFSERILLGQWFRPPRPMDAR